MAATRPDPSRTGDAITIPYLILAALAVAVGFFARFKGLGFAPVGSDEYYLSRSVDSILRYGVPAFDCGGYYQRGLGLQYLVAGLRWLGLSPEFAPRVIAATSSLLTLPAVYLIGRRFLTANVALIAASFLAVSLWEIEISRFGRFYAPFQAITAWYVYFFLRHVVDREQRAWWTMLALTLLGAMAWEGAVFLALANLVPVLIDLSAGEKISRRYWWRSIGAASLLPLIYLFVSAPLRYLSDVPAHPADYVRTMMVQPTYRLDAIHLPGIIQFATSAWVIGGVVLLILAGVNVRWLWSWRARPMTVLGLTALLIAALARQFAVCAAIVLLLTLLKQLHWQELRASKPGVFAATLAVIVVFWLTWALSTVDWPSTIATTGGSAQAAIAVVYQFVRFPDVIGEIVRPFIVTVPLLSVLLFAALALATLRVCLTDSELRSPPRVLLILVVLLILGVGASDPPRHETRYVYFLYPLWILLAVYACAWIVELVRTPARHRAAATSLLALGALLASEDFSLRHILSVDSPQTTFRTYMTPFMRNHLGESRDDFRHVAQWLQARGAAGQITVINSIHGFDYYYPRTRYFYVEEQSTNFVDFSCRRGTVDRWSNLPLLYTPAGLRSAAATAPATYLVTWADSAPAVLAAVPDLRPQVVMTEGATVVIAMAPQARPQ